MDRDGHTPSAADGDAPAEPTGEQRRPDDAWSKLGPELGEQFRQQFDAYRQSAGHFVRLRAERAIYHARRYGVLSLLMGLAFCVAGAAVIVATAMVLSGVAEGLGHLFGDRLWLGSLVTGLGVLAGSAFGVWLAVRLMLASFQRRMAQLYQDLQRRQQERSTRDGDD